MRYNSPGASNGSPSSIFHCCQTQQIMPSGASCNGFAACPQVERSQFLPRGPVVGCPKGPAFDVGQPGSLVESKGKSVGAANTVHASEQQFASAMCLNRLPLGLKYFGEQKQASLGYVPGVTEGTGSDFGGEALTVRRSRKRPFSDDSHVTGGSEPSRSVVGASLAESGARQSIEGPSSIPSPSVIGDVELSPASGASAGQERKAKIVKLVETVMQMKIEAKEVKRLHQVWGERKQELETIGRVRSRHKAKVLDLHEGKPDFAARKEGLLQKASKILEQVSKHQMAQPFLIPVDVIRYGLFDYYQIVRKPMDLGTIRSMLDAKGKGGYKDVRELCHDIRLVFRNAMTYHSETTQIYKMAWTLSKCFEKKWSHLEREVIDLEATTTRQTLYMDSCDDVRHAELMAKALLKQLDEVGKQLTILRAEGRPRFRTTASEEKGKVHEVLGRPCKVKKEAVLWSLYTALKRQAQCEQVQEASSEVARKLEASSHSYIPVPNLGDLTPCNTKRPRSFHTVRPRTSFEGMWNCDEEQPDHDRCRINNGKYTYRCKAKVVPGFKTCLYHREKARELARRKIEERRKCTQ